MTRQDYLRYLAAFNARDYAAMEAFFADDFLLENAGFAVRGKPAFRAFYAFFHEHCREEVFFKEFFTGEDGGASGFIANVVIRFTGLKDLSPEILMAKGYAGMVPVPAGSTVELEFYIHYLLDAAGLIRHIKGAVWEPALANRP